MKDTQDLMQAIASTLDKALNEPNRKRNGFVVLVFPLTAPKGEEQRVNYVSNVQRDDVVSALKEVIARFEGQPRLTGKGRQ